MVFESTIESPFPRKIIIAMLLAATLPDVVQFSGVDQCNRTERQGSSWHCPPQKPVRRCANAPLSVAIACASSAALSFFFPLCPDQGNNPWQDVSRRALLALLVILAYEYKSKFEKLYSSSFRIYNQPGSLQTLSVTSQYLILSVIFLIFFCKSQDLRN